MRVAGVRLTLAVGAAIASAPLASALRIATNSPCARHCGNVLGSTQQDELVCQSANVGRGAVGAVWETCIRCQLESTYTYQDQTDLQWLLYNLRYATNYCMFTNNGTVDIHLGPCAIDRSCEQFRDAVENNNLTLAEKSGPYDYCNRWESDFYGRCTDCLRRLDDDVLLLDNYITVLQAACEQKPAPGATLSLDGDIFGSTPLVITTPEVTYESVPLPDYGPVSLGARVGIAFGALAFLLVLAGFIIVCNGKRRRRAYLRELERRNGGKGLPHPKTRYGGGGDMFETPVSQRPLNGWDESPVSAHTETTERPLPRYFSPYSSQYNSPVSGPAEGGSATAAWPTAPSSQRLDQLIQEQSPAHGSPPPAFTQWPSPTQAQALMQLHHHHEKRQTEIAIGLALGGDEASLRSKASNPSISGIGLANGFPSDVKGKQPDEMYELQEVESPYSGDRDHYRMPQEPEAPVLHHPGYGRHHESRPAPDSRGGAKGSMAGLGLQGVEPRGVLVC